MLLLWMACRGDAPMPTSEAFRGGAGYWPENSALAIAGVTRERLPAVSLDLSLASDGVAMVLRGPTLDPARCTWTDGIPFQEAPLVAELTASDIEETVWCGGLPQPDFVNAIVRAEPPLRLDAAMGVLRTSGAAIRWMISDPALLDVLLARWLALDPPNRLIVSSRDEQLLQDAEAAFAIAGIDLTTALVGTVADAHDAVVLEASGTAAEVRDARDLGLEVWVEAEGGVALDVDVISSPYPGDVP